MQKIFFLVAFLFFAAAIVPLGLAYTALDSNPVLSQTLTYLATIFGILITSLILMVSRGSFKKGVCWQCIFAVAFAALGILHVINVYFPLSIFTSLLLFALVGFYVKRELMKDRPVIEAQLYWILSGSIIGLFVYVASFVWLVANALA